MASGKKKVKLGVIGCGRIAWLGFLPCIEDHPGAELVAIADIDEELLNKTARKFRPHNKYTDWRELIEQSGADAVCILAPPWLHADPTVAAAQQGMHVLCEKPMATSVEDCRRMIAACEENDVSLQIGFSLRFDSGYGKLKELVATGEIGEVFQLKSEYDIWVPDLSKTPFKEILKIGGSLRLLETPDMGSWRMNDARTGGGVFSDHGIHYADLFSWIMGEKFVSVYGVKSDIVPGRAAEDHASAMLRFESGIPAYIEASLARFDARDEIDEGIIYGTKGCLKYEMDQSWYLRGYPHLNNNHAKVWKYGTPSLVLGQWLPVPVKHRRRDMMFRRQMNYFIKKINGTYKPHPVFGEKWAADGYDGLRSIQIVKALYESSDNKKSVDIEDLSF